MNELTKRILADNIRLFRVKKRFSQEAVADLVGLAQNQISELENEQANPNLETIIKIANALNISVSELFIEH